MPFKLLEIQMNSTEDIITNDEDNTTNDENEEIFINQQIDLNKLNFGELLEHLQKKTEVLKKLIKHFSIKSVDQHIESINENVDKHNKKSNKKINKKKKLTCTEEISQYVQNLIELKSSNDYLEWGVNTLISIEENENCKIIKTKLNDYLRSEKNINAEAALNNSENIVKILKKNKNLFDLNEISELKSKHSFLNNEIEKLMNYWKETSEIEINKSTYSIMKQIIKYFEKNKIDSACYDDIINSKKVLDKMYESNEQISLNEFRNIIKKSSYSKIFTITTNDIVNINFNEAAKIDSEKIKTSLNVDNLIKQISMAFKNNVKPTDLQKYLYELFHTNEKFAICLDSAPGSGKSTGMLTNNNGMTIYSPINQKSYIEMITSTLSASIPFVMVQKNEVGEIIYTESWETMGKTLKFDTSTGEDFNDRHPKSLKKLYIRLKQLENLSQEDINRRILVEKNAELNKLKKPTFQDVQKIEGNLKKRKIYLNKKKFTSSEIQFIICHPDLRTNGLLQVYEDADELNKYYKNPKLITVVIDDFGANSDKMTDEMDVIKLCCIVERIILSSGTCPKGLDNEESPINLERKKNNLSDFIYKRFDKTLGLGIALNYLSDNPHHLTDNPHHLTEKKRYSLLLCDKKTFEKSPSSLQTITMTDVFELIKIKYQDQTRNFLLDCVFTVSLDDLRQNVVDWLYSLADDERIAIVNDVINRKQYSEKKCNQTQTLFLDSNPVECTIKHFGLPTNKMTSVDGTEMNYIDCIEYNLENYEKMVKIQNKQIESLKKRKSAEEGTTEEMMKEVGSAEFNRSGVNIMFDRKFVKEQLEFRGIVSDDQIKYLLQKSILVVKPNSDNKWVNVGIKKSAKNIIGTPIEMGIGVDIPKLTKVYLGSDVDLTITKQNIGRVGRSCQGIEGTAIFPNLNMITQLYCADIGEELEHILNQAISKYLKTSQLKYCHSIS